MNTKTKYHCGECDNVFDEQSKAELCCTGRCEEIVPNVLHLNYQCQYGKGHNGPHRCNLGTVGDYLLIEWGED